MPPILFQLQRMRPGGLSPRQFTKGVPPFRGAKELPMRAPRSIVGVTRDSVGTVLPACVVDLFATVGDRFVTATTSDGSGNYSFNVGDGSYYVVAYKAGAPDVAGTTVNTLVGADA